MNKILVIQEEQRRQELANDIKWHTEGKVTKSNNLEEAGVSSAIWIIGIIIEEGPSATIVEGTFEPGKHHLPAETKSRPKPKAHSLLGTCERAFDSLRKALLSAELITSQEKLPLLYHGIIIMFIVAQGVTPQNGVHRGHHFTLTVLHHGG